MKDNYERLRKEYLNICDEDCGGDPSTGIQPCPFFEYEEGCLLKSEKFRAAPGIKYLASRSLRRSDRVQCASRSIA